MFLQVRRENPHTGAALAGGRRLERQGALSMTVETWILLAFVFVLVGLAPAVTRDGRPSSGPAQRQPHRDDAGHDDDDDDGMIWHTPVAGAPLQSMSFGARAQHLSGIGTNGHPR